MRSAVDSSAGRHSAPVATLAGALSAILGLTVLVAWHTRTVGLIQVRPTFAPMQYNTALAFLMCGTGLVALARGRGRLTVASASMAGAIGLLSLIEYAFGVQLGIDELFIDHYIEVQTSHAGRMAPNSALAFLLTAVALLVATKWKGSLRGFMGTGGPGLVVATLGGTALFGYLTGVESEFGWGQLTRMAVHTSVGFMILAAGILFVAFEGGIARAAAEGETGTDPLTRERRMTILVSVGMMAFVSVAVGLTALRQTYHAALAQHRAWLSDMVEARVLMIEAVARFDAEHSRDVEGGARAATLSQVVEAHQRSQGFGRSGEFTIARLEGDELHFVMAPRFAGSDSIERIEVGLPTAQPMRLAVRGESGTLIGVDYRNELVIAAYAPVTTLGIGVVAKIDLAEVRAPFVRSSLLIAALALLIIALGGSGIFVSIGPLLRRVEEQAADLRAANVELRAERERLSLALEGGSVGLWDRNLRTGEVVYNQRWAEMLGYSLDEIEPTKEFFFSLVHPEDLRVFTEVLDEHLEGRVPSFEVEHRMRTKSGDWAWILDKGKVMERDEDGRPLRVAGTHMDITEQRALEAQLRQAQKMEAVGQLTGGIAHDFNNVLSIIILNADLVLQTLEPYQNAERGEVAEIRDAARRASGITEQLLGFARQAALKPVPSDIPQIVRGILSMIETLLPESVEISVRGDDPVSAVEVDSHAVEQILLNLATNASDAMPGGGRLTIDVCEVELDEAYAVEHLDVVPGSYVRVSVTDTGVGIGEETLQHIFDPFFTTKEAGQGTGLGMAMVHGLMKQLGGRVEVWSEPGHGTTVNLDFPTTGATAAEAPEEEPTGLPGGTQTILLVEDEDGLRRAGKRVLERYGYQVLEAADGEEGLEAYRRHADDIDLVLSDLVMPKLSGTGLYEALEIATEGRPPKFLLASGYLGDETQLVDGLPESVPFVRKPWDINTLLQKVRAVLDGSE